MRRNIALLLYMLFVGADYSGPTPRERLRAEGVVRVTPIPLDAENPARRDLGPLRFVAGWAISSDNRAFGGWSGMTSVGDRLALVSDSGSLFSVRPDGGALRDPRFGELPAGPGSEYRKRWRDSEAIAADPATGRLWVTFENRHSIFRYAPGFSRLEAAAPLPARGWGANGGAEAMTRLADGRFAIFAEGGALPGGPRDALLYPGDPTAGARPLRFGYRPPGRFRVTDVAQLPDGHLLLLERETGWPFVARLTVADPATIRAGEVLASREIARLAPPIVTDNYESLAVTREAGRTIVWIGSDDNNLPVQRTLLLKFEWNAIRRPERAPAGDSMSR